MSIRFNASGDLAVRTATAPAYTHTSPYTVMVWVKLISDRNAYSNIIGLGSTANYAIQTGSDGTTLIFYNTAAEIGTFALTVGTWYHIAFTHSNVGACVVYVDGVSRITDSNSNDPTAGRIEFGNDTFDEWADAEFRGARCWTTDLTSGEVAAERASTTVVKTASLWADWDMPNAADAGADRSGNSRPLSYTSISDGASDPTIYSGAATKAPPIRLSPLRYLIHF